MSSNLEKRLAGKDETMSFGLFTSYVYEDQFFLMNIQNPNANLLIVIDEKQTSHFKVKKHPLLGESALVIFPPKAAGLFYGVFHPKLIILKFETFLRVIISSANITSLDWDVLAQVIWFQDFPKIDSKKLQDEKINFPIQLHDFIAKIVPSNELQKVPSFSDYDFSNIAVDLVKSVNGWHTGNDMDNYGIGYIRKLMKQYPSNIKNGYLTIQATSIRKLDNDYLNQLYSAFKGKNTTKFNPKIKEKIRIQFPTDNYIVNVTKQKDNADCILLENDVYYNKDFPKECFYCLEPKKDVDAYMKALYHAKVIIFSNHDNEINDNTIIYIGSHNISPSAWGNLTKDKKKLKMMNYELGIIFKPMPNSKSMKENIMRTIPFQFPPPKYTSKDIPWIYDNY